jgi:hypothetical protein
MDTTRAVASTAAANSVTSIPASPSPMWIGLAPETTETRCPPVLWLPVVDSGAANAHGERLTTGPCVTALTEPPCAPA